MHVEFLIEEPSMEAVLENIAPRILTASHTFKTHNFGDKSQLLRKLPNRLRGYRSWIPDDWRIVVLIDEDRQDCHALKDQLERIAAEFGFRTKTNSIGGHVFQVLNRIVIEELEAWFFGDVNAIVAAYPRVSKNIGKNARYRNPDAIKGGTWEALERELKARDYYPQGLPKIEAAKNISQHMDPDRNSSNSFQVFRDGLRIAVGF